MATVTSVRKSCVRVQPIEVFIEGCADLEDSEVRAIAYEAVDGSPLDYFGARVHRAVTGDAAYVRIYRD
jgi:hypothetical protein